MSKKKLSKAYKAALKKAKEAGKKAKAYFEKFSDSGYLNKSLNGLTIILLSSFVFLFFSVAGPSMYENYLRAKVGQVVIKVIKDSRAVSGGTGFIVKAASGQSYILTNYHVCAMNGQKIGDLVLATTPDESRQMYRKIIDISQDADLCLVETIPGLKGVDLAGSYAVGDDLAVIGHPLLNPLTVSRGRIMSKKIIQVLFEYNLTQEDCEGRGRRFHFADLSSNIMAAFMGVTSACFTQDLALETNAETYPGNSGSPVVNIYGNLIGVLFAGNGDDHWGYIVPLEQVRDFLSVY